MEKPPEKNNSEMNSAEAWQAGFDAHRREEILFTARNTTPAQRFAWLEEMLELLKPQMPQLIANRERDRARQQKERQERPVL